MFKYLKMSKMNEDGTEHVCAKVGPFALDEDGLGQGKIITLTNNHANNTYEIVEGRLVRGRTHFIRVIEKGKEDTKTVDEFKCWLIRNNYCDKDFLREMENSYKESYEKYYK